ncbi:MAG TPA: Orn/Lys/Arg decarboxylase N-terminal domain-containing protein, partial [Devosia sp.]|nr:Orn/Lys/Arg decarboxylase N-terminal domain-containing protein [Devosia sp.]
MSMNAPWILVVTSDPPDSGSVFRFALQRLGEAMKQQGIEVVPTHSWEDGLGVARGSATYSGVAIDWNLGETAQPREDEVLAIIQAVRRKSLRIPIFLLTRDLTEGTIPWSIVSEVREYVNLAGETPEFFA